jgi:deoxyribodipyrimidine photo-lyase
MKDKLGKDSGIIRQMYWRDFFYNLSYLHPEIYKGAMTTKYNNIKWENDLSKFKKWCDGKTGFPVVDACMKELNTTGYMHNRGRLIVSNFLVRLLHIDWRWGEKYFAKQLYDYDPAQNNFGWQTGAATTPTISRPLSQTILNPWIQSSNFDNQGYYIKKWLPELKDVNSKDLHKWNDSCKLYLEQGVKYLEPIIDYKKEKEYNLALYKKYI